MTLRLREAIYLGGHLDFKQRITLSIWVLLLAVLFSTPAEAATGAAFLKIPNGATEISLGMSGVSHSSGSNAIWWNPARIGIGGSYLGIQFFRWLGDGRGTVGTAGFKTKWGGLGASVFDLGMDGFEARERPGPADAEFTVHQSIAVVGGALNLPYGMRGGLSFKGFIEQIYGDVSAQFPLIDAGLNWTGGQWNAGAAVSNMVVNDRMGDPPPLTGRIGVTRIDRVGAFQFKDAVELSFVRNLPGWVHVGLEVGYSERFYLRGGVAANKDDVRPTFGLGMETGSYIFNGGMALFDQALGSTWRAGFAYRL
jgi:hypothetical protein